MQHSNILRLPHREQAARHHLPTQLTPLLGREREVAAACALLRGPQVRLLTLTGTGGVGKTRLAFHIAEALVDDFADGVSFVSLAPLSDPELVVPTIAQSLDLKETGYQSVLDVLKASLRNKALLLVLDNFEHVVPAAPLLVELLQACPHLKILVTSRTLLRLSGERECSVSPLAVPDLSHLPATEALSQYAAVALFLQRAQALKPDLQVTSTNAQAIAEICVRLDGLPLAIELAAARIKLLSPQALLTRLSQRFQVLTSGTRDAPVRQQTLRNTLEWSYRLLDATEQRLFRRLAVFVGGCTLETLEALSVALDGEAGAVLDGVASLLDKSLLHQREQGEGESRLMMLETLREYGLECLKLNEEEEITRCAHASYYFTILEKVGPNLNGPDQRKWLDLLEREHNNLRSALQWSTERKDAELALQLSHGLSMFWYLRGYQVEGRQWLDRVLAASEDAPTSLRVQVLHGATRLALHQGDFSQAQEMAEKMLALCRKTGERRYIALALRRLGEIAEVKHNYGAAYSLLEESLEILREIMSHHSPGLTETIKRNLAYGLTDLAPMISYQGDFARAYALGEEGLALFRELNDWKGMVFGLGRLGKIMIAQGDYARAYAEQEEAFSQARELDLKNDATSLLHLLGQIALYQGDGAAAGRLLKETLAPYTALGSQWRRAHVLVLLATIGASQGDDAEVRSLYEECLATLREIDDKEAIAAFLEEVAEAVIQKSPAWGVKLWGCAEALREAVGIAFSPMEFFPYKRSLATAQACLGQQSFATTWAEGRTMTYEQALAVYRPTPKPVSTSSTNSRVPSPNQLTNREIEVLRLVAQGLTDIQVAEQLVISPHTVNAHLKSIYGKIQVTSRSAATRYALEHHLM
jgi:predicted ATPase/DNA-binding NarL/FixJ family response regulator